MFSEELEKIDWEETTKAIYSKTESDVLRALGKEHCDVDDFMALISPAAAKYLEPMAQLSKKYTEERFGKTISMFIPLYITNSCTNSCVYCGFHISNPMARTILTPEQMEDEYKAIKKLGPFENLLLVTGENPAKAGVPYLAKALDIAKKYFSNLKIEVMPLKAEEYAERVCDALRQELAVVREDLGKAYEFEVKRGFAPALESLFHQSVHLRLFLDVMQKIRSDVSRYDTHVQKQLEQLGGVLEH